MADWRKLYGEINDSEKFHSVPERTRLGYFQAYLATDKRGFLPWSTKKLRAIAFGLTDWSLEEVEKIRDDLVRIGLWLPRKDAAGQRFVYVWRFDETQGEPARRARETPSKFGDPVDAEEVHDLTSVTDTNGVQNGHSEESRVEKKRGEALSQDRPTVSGSKKQEAKMILPRVQDAFREALGSPHWLLTERRERAVAKYAGLLSEHPDLVAGFRIGIETERAKESDETWLFENVLEYLSTHPKAGYPLPPRAEWQETELERIRRENDEILAADAARPKRTPEEIAADIARMRSGIGRPVPAGGAS